MVLGDTVLSQPLQTLATFDSVLRTTQRKIVAEEDGNDRLMVGVTECSACC